MRLRHHKDCGSTALTLYAEKLPMFPAFTIFSVFILTLVPILSNLPSDKALHTIIINKDYNWNLKLSKNKIQCSVKLKAKSQKQNKNKKNNYKLQSYHKSSVRRFKKAKNRPHQVGGVCVGANHYLLTPETQVWVRDVRDVHTSFVSFFIFH